MKQIDYIWIVSPIGYAHSHAFDVVAESFLKSLQELGHKADITRENRHGFTEGRRIVFGAHLLHYKALTNTDIIYQSEQVGTVAMSNGYLNFLSACEVWDYSKVNLERLEKDHGIKAKHVPIGYHPCMTNPLIPKLIQDIDVLFYGSINQRRRVILDQLKAKGLKVVELFGVYGDKLDEYIARSKIILNVHYYDTAIFEIFRCAYLFANKKCVVSETGKDLNLEDSGALRCHYNDLVEKVDLLLQKDSIRNLVADSGFDIFSKVSQKSILEGVLK